MVLHAITKLLNKIFPSKNNPIENVNNYTAKIKNENGEEIKVPECDIKDAKPEEIKK